MQFHTRQYATSDVLARGARNGRKGSQSGCGCEGFDDAVETADEVGRRGLFALMDGPKTGILDNLERFISRVVHRHPLSCVVVKHSVHGSGVRSREHEGAALGQRCIRNLDIGRLVGSNDDFLCDDNLARNGATGRESCWRNSQECACRGDCAS